MDLRLAPALLATALLAGRGRAAFEPVAQSPWLEGGYAACQFPRSPMACCSNPALAGLMESACLSASASRPFGLRELDRAALSASVPFAGTVACGILTASGNRTYSELTLSAPFAWRASPGLILGVSPCLHRLAIQGYGSAAAFSAGLGAVCRPVEGVYLSAGTGGLAATDLGRSGDPAAPLSLSAGLGVCPVSCARLALGVSRQEGLPMEASASASFFLEGPFGLQFSFESSPARFAAAVCLDVSKVEVLCGYAEHPALGGSPALEVVWGRAAFQPEPVQALRSEDTEPASDIVVDINSAGPEELCSLPGIGPARAEAIMRWREENGPFGSVDELADIPGISAAMVETLRGRLAAR